MTEKEQLQKNGFRDGQIFELVELNGLYRIDIAERAVYEVRIKTSGEISYICKVPGLYESLLRGSWHKKKP